MLSRIFNAGKLGIEDDIAGHPDGEDLTDAAGEDGFGYFAGIGTGDDGSVGMLAIGIGFFPDLR